MKKLLLMIALVTSASLQAAADSLPTKKINTYDEYLDNKGCLTLHRFGCIVRNEIQYTDDKKTANKKKAAYGKYVSAGCCLTKKQFYGILSKTIDYNAYKNRGSSGCTFTQEQFYHLPKPASSITDSK